MLRWASSVALFAACLAAQDGRYADPLGRFSLQPPAGWSTQASPDGNVVFRDPGGRVSLGVAPTALAEPTTLAAASAAFGELLRKRQGLTVKPAGDEDLQIGETAARRSSFDLSAGLNELRLESTFVLLPETLLTLTATAPAHLFAQHRDHVRAAVQSLRLGGEQQRPPAGDVDRQLAALEAARAAGVVDEQEYATKKKALESKRSAKTTPDPELPKKLQALEAARAAGVITEAEYARKRADLLDARKPAAPDAPAAAPQDAPAPPPERPAAKGALYQHPIGFQLWHPQGWKVLPQEECLQLMPPDPSGTAEAPHEIYLLIGDAIEDEDLKSPDDPRVGQYLDQQLQSIAPVLRRQGAPTAVAMARGKGARYEWRGQMEGQPEVVARGYACIIKNYGIALLAIGFPKDLDKREATLRQIFASFGFGEGKKDPALVGTWSLLATTSLRNDSPYETSWSRARLVSDTSSTLTFAADGSWKRIDRHHMIAMGAGVAIEDKSEKQSQGTWNAADGGLFMIWSDKTWEDYRYELRRTERGTELRLITGNTGQVWQRQ